MRTELLVCPKDKCPLDLLADLGKETVNAWIYLHDNAVDRIAQSATEDIMGNEFREMYWEATDDYPSTEIYLDKAKRLDWHLIYKIEADDIAFKSIIATPEILFFVKMQEEK